jgi:hypothetical protein
MKTTGRYCTVESDYDLDHEITRNVEKVEELILTIDTDRKDVNKRAIVVACIEVLLKEI